MSDGSDLPIRAAIERYLRRRSVDATESTQSTLHYRLKLFAEWCDEQGIETIADLDAWTLDEYYDARAGQVAPATLEGEMYTLKGFAEYIESFADVADDLAGAVRIPDLDDEARASDAELPEERALDLLAHYRDAPAWQGTRRHAFLELAWHTGARMGAIRALDVRDVALDDAYVEFYHRPETGTPLKNKADGERAVGIPDAVGDALRTYLRQHRYDVRDDHGRQPFLASQQGRASKPALRNWSYLATEPCIHSPCPHGKDRESCEWTEYNHASKCPSSRAPHAIRTGSITWQLNIGIPPEIVAQRVNATLDVIERHYDQESPVERMERRRRQYIDQMDIHQPDSSDNDT